MIINNQLFPIEYNVRITTNIVFNNIIAKNNNTSEQRIIRNEYPTREYSIFKNILTGDQLTSLRNFFNTTATGALNGFLFKDPIDNKASNTATQVYETAYEIGVLTPSANGVNTTFQVNKAYQLENNYYYQPIYWPYNLRLYKDGIEITSGFTHNRGIVIFTSPPTTGVLTASFDFYFPVRFKSDILTDKILSCTVNNNKVFQLQGLELVEIKTDYADYPPSVFTEITEVMPVDLRWGQDFQSIYNTSLKDSTSQREIRTKKQVLPETKVTLKEKSILTQQEALYLVHLFLNTKGRGRTFRYKEATSDTIYEARFDSDTLSLVNQSTTLINELQPIGLKLFPDGQVVDRDSVVIDTSTFIVFLVDNSDSSVNPSSHVTSVFNAASQVKTELTTTLFNGNTTEANKYIIVFYVLSGAGGRYLNQLAVNRAGTDPEKYFYFYYAADASINSSGQFSYHSIPRDVGEEPTNNYLTDFSNFAARRLQMQSFRCDFLIDVNNPNGFKAHLNDAINGNGNYSSQIPANFRVNELDFESPNIESLLVNRIKQSLGLQGILGSNHRSSGPILYLAYLVKITTSRGDIFAYTSHDKPLVVEGLSYFPNGGLSSSALVSKSDASLDSNKNDLFFFQFDEAVLFSGILKNATVEIAVVDWTALPATLIDDINVISYQEGVIGEITSNGEYYSIEFLSFAASRLNQTHVSKTQSNCPYQFMSEKCGYPSTEWVATVTEVATANWLALVGGYNKDQARGGFLIFISGELKGARYGVNNVENDGTRDKFILTNFLTKSPQIGDQVVVSPGCSKTESDCKNYGNFINFGGIPTGGGWMPGNNYLISAPRRS